MKRRAEAYYVDGKKTTESETLQALEEGTNKPKDGGIGQRAAMPVTW